MCLQDSWESFVCSCEQARVPRINPRGGRQQHRHRGHLAAVWFYFYFAHLFSYSQPRSLARCTAHQGDGQHRANSLHTRACGTCPWRSTAGARALLLLGLCRISALLLLHFATSTEPGPIPCAQQGDAAARDPSTALRVPVAHSAQSSSSIPVCSGFGPHHPSG